MQTPVINGQLGILSPVQNVHPPDGFSVADLTQIDLSRFQILRSQNNLGDDLHIYIQEEIADLINASRNLTPLGSLRRYTYATLFGLLA